MTLNFSGFKYSVQLRVNYIVPHSSGLNYWSRNTRQLRISMTLSALGRAQTSTDLFSGFSQKASYQQSSLNAYIQDKSSLSQSKNHQSCEVYKIFISLLLISPLTLFSLSLSLSLSLTFSQPISSQLNPSLCFSNFLPPTAAAKRWDCNHKRRVPTQSLHMHILY